MAVYPVYLRENRKIKQSKSNEFIMKKIQY